MTALTGLLDGETANALKGLYGVNSAEDTLAKPGEVNGWSEYEDSEEADVYCDNCGEELLEEELPLDMALAEEFLCGECERRSSTHAVERFISIRSRDRDELD